MELGGSVRDRVVHWVAVTTQRALTAATTDEAVTTALGGASLASPSAHSVIYHGEYQATLKFSDYCRYIWNIKPRSSPLSLFRLRGVRPPGHQRGGR